jgi:hypothetical protein
MSLNIAYTYSARIFPANASANKHVVYAFRELAPSN